MVRLKDSDVTWLYGPLHTAVEAVPPPRVATASERLGLEPLRSLSDSKSMRKAAPVTKPILKYRSLSDILMPPGTPASPILEHGGLDFVASDVNLPHSSKSDSNLARLNRKSRLSPTHSPREMSPDRAVASDSSASTSSRNGERRHISFNHRVEQCIAVDSTDEAKKYPTTNSGSEDDGDDEDEVLTFKSSPRTPAFGPATMSAARSRSSSNREPHTIARLGPTTLKSLELYPHPSPAVVYHDAYQPEQSSVVGNQNTYGAPTNAAYPGRPADPSRGPSQPTGRQAMYDYATGAGGAQWDQDEDENYAMGFDYFTGPDVSVGDEYDMAQYGSQHLVHGAHDNYQPGAPSTYQATGGYSTAAAYNPSPSHSSTTSTESSPNHSRRSSNNPPPKTPSPSTTSPSSSYVVPAGIRGPYAPSPSSKESVIPKRSILKNRSRENSSGADEPLPVIQTRFGGASPVSQSPTGSGGSGGSGHASPTSMSSSPASSPYASSSSLAAVMSNAGIPQVLHIKTGPMGARRVGSEEVIREARGRSTSRGSASSLERSASADRRSSSSISPASSYSPPSIIAPGGGARPIGIPGSRRGGSSDSLSSMAGTLMGGREVMPGLPEASSESETETVRQDDEPPVVHVASSLGAQVTTIEDVDAVPLSVDPVQLSGSLGRPTYVNLAPGVNTNPTSGLISPPLVPAPSSASALNRASTSSKYRQPSPSAPTTSTTDDGDLPLESPSLSNSPALDPADLASTPWSDETPVPSYARRSLLRASRGGHAPTLERDDSRGSIDSGRGSTHDDYGFGYYDEDADTGIVGRTFEVAGTARDLLGALSKGIWNFGRRT